MGKQHFAVGAIGAVCAASSVQAQDITITNLVDPQDEKVACVNAFQGETYAGTACDKALEFLNELTPKIEEAHYDLFLAINDNTKKYDAGLAIASSSADDFDKMYLADGV